MNPDEIRRLECLRIAAEVIQLDDYNTASQAATETLKVAVLFERWVLNGTTQTSE